MSKFCTNCGTKLDDGVKFCTSCGKATESDTISNNNQPVNNTTNVTVNNGGEKKTNGLAIAGFVMSIVSVFLCCGILNVPGLILSIVGLVKAKDYNGDGKGLAIAGIIISAIVIVIGIILSTVLTVADWENIFSEIESV